MTLLFMIHTDTDVDFDSDRNVDIRAANANIAVDPGSLVYPSGLSWDNTIAVSTKVQLLLLLALSLLFARGKNRDRKVHLRRCVRRCTFRSR